MVNEAVQAHNISQFEALIDGLLNQGFGVCDDFLSPALAAGLRDNLLAFNEEGEMAAAGIGRKFDFQKNIRVRGDVIKWLPEATEDPFEMELLSKIGHFIQYLNETCYTSLNGKEFHYACYETGSFYKRHLDQFKSDRGRKFSLVLYLNEDWKESDGGYLTLYPEDIAPVDVYPLGGRAVFFRSDEMEHEVHPSPTRERLSIAGWLKSV